MQSCPIWKLMPWNSYPSPYLHGWSWYLRYHSFSLRMTTTSAMKTYPIILRQQGFNMFMMHIFFTIAYINPYFCGTIRGLTHEAEKPRGEKRLLPIPCEKWPPNREGWWNLVMRRRSQGAGLHDTWGWMWPATKKHQIKWHSMIIYLYI